jgi:hypothetical protein
VGKVLIAATAFLGFASQQAFAATSVAAWSIGSTAYDATTATLTATHSHGSAKLSNSKAAIGSTNVPVVATVKINFAAPLVRTNEIQQIEWTGSGHRYIASFVRGTAIGFEYVVNALPDVNGITTNLLTIKSQPGFSVPFVSLEQLSYYYDFVGNSQEGSALLYNPYRYYYDFAFIGVFPPCNCSNSSQPLGPKLTPFSATSDINNYVQNLYMQSNAFRLGAYGTGLDLWDVTVPGTSVASSFNVTSSAEWSPAVPEPASWAMMIAGFGLIGTSLRHRRRLAIA